MTIASYVTNLHKAANRVMIIKLNETLYSGHVVISVVFYYTQEGHQIVETHRNDAGTDSVHCSCIHL